MSFKQIVEKEETIIQKIKHALIIGYAFVFAKFNK